MERASRLRRRRFVRWGIPAVGVAGLAALGWWWWTSPPSEPPEYAEPRPETLDERYVSVMHTVLIDASPEEVQRWNNDPSRGLDDMIEGGEDFPTVVGTHNLVGQWDPDADRTGDRRRVEFADGHFLAEEVLIDTPETFRYMIWGFTDSRRLMVSQGAAQFEFLGEGDRTRVIWTYSLAPTVSALRPFVSDFLTGPMSEMMRNTLEAMRDGVESQ